MTKTPRDKRFPVVLARALAANKKKLLKK